MCCPGSAAVWSNWLSLQARGWHALQVTSLPATLYMSLPFFPVLLSHHNMKWQGLYKNHSGLVFCFFFYPFLIPRFTADSFFDNFCISALWVVGFHISVSWHYCRANDLSNTVFCTELELLGLDYQDKKNCITLETSLGVNMNFMDPRLLSA